MANSFGAHRVKLPKTFLAINLSDAFTFEEHDKQGSDQEGGLEMKSVIPQNMAPAGAGIGESTISNALAAEEAASIANAEDTTVDSA